MRTPDSTWRSIKFQGHTIYRDPQAVIGQESCYLVNGPRVKWTEAKTITECKELIGGKDG